MKLSFGVLFLGWWLDGGLAQNISLTKVKGKIASRRIKQDASYSKPVIFTHPSGVIPLGGNISITCKTDLHVAADFYLWRKGTCTKDFEPTNLNEHDFFISEVQQSDGQIYFCAYCFFGDTDHECSVYSDEINITVRDPSLSEPAILVKPSKDIYPGTKVSFYCQGPETGLTYSLWRAKVLAGTRMAEPDSQIVEFPLFKVKTEDTGNYSCHYQLKGNPFVWSLQSDSIKMIVNARSLAVIWANVAAGFLGFLLVLFTYMLCKKRRRGAISVARNETDSVERDNESESTEKENESESSEKDFESESVERDTISENVERDNVSESAAKENEPENIHRESESKSIDRDKSKSFITDNESESIDRVNEPESYESIYVPRLI